MERARKSIPSGASFVSFPQGSHSCAAYCPIPVNPVLQFVWFYSCFSWEGKSRSYYSIWVRIGSSQHFPCLHSEWVSSGHCTKHKPLAGALNFGWIAARDHFSKIPPSIVYHGSSGIPASLNRKIHHFSKIPGQSSCLFPLSSGVLARVLHLMSPQSSPGTVGN